MTVWLWVSGLVSGFGVRAGIAVTLVSATVAPASLPGSTAVTPAERPFAAVDAYARERMNVTGTPGMALAVVGPDGPLHTTVWGVDGHGHPVTTETPFLWGSVSKPVTAAAVMTLVEDGRVELDAPVRSYLPDFALADAEASAGITVRQLLDQTSGIPGGTELTDRFDPSAAPYQQVLTELAEVQPVAEPGLRFEYSSVNFLVAGAVVAAVTGQDYGDYLRESVLEPLGMHTAITNPDDAAARLPPGYRYVYGRPVAFDTPYDPVGASYGYLGGSVRDLGRFARTQLSGRIAGQPALTAASRRQLQEVSVEVDDGRAYGLGWWIATGDAAPGTRMVWHAGASPGYLATVVLLPRMDRAVVVLQNAYGIFQDRRLVDLGLGVAAIIAGEEPDPASGDLLYPAVLSGLTALAGALLVLTVAWSRRLLEPVRGHRGRHRRTVLGLLAAAGCLLVAGLAGWWLPAQAGTRLSATVLWAPDVGALLWAITGAGVLLAVLRAAALVRER